VYLSEKGVAFDYFDISTDFMALKSFLMIRDNKPQYDEIKKAGRVGLPTVIIDNDIYIDPQHGDLDKLL